METLKDLNIKKCIFLFNFARLTETNSGDNILVRYDSRKVNSVTFCSSIWLLFGRECAVEMRKLKLSWRKSSLCLV